MHSTRPSLAWRRGQLIALALLLIAPVPVPASQSVHGAQRATKALPKVTQYAATVIGNEWCTDHTLYNAGSTSRGTFEVHGSPSSEEDFTLRRHRIWKKQICGGELPDMIGTAAIKANGGILT